MRTNFLSAAVAAIVLALSSASNASAFELLDRMLGIGHHHGGGCNSCCEPSCCEPVCEPACCEPVYEQSCCDPCNDCCDPCCRPRCGFRLFAHCKAFFARCRAACCAPSCCDPCFAEPSCCTPEPSCCN